MTKIYFILTLLCISITIYADGGRRGNLEHRAAYLPQGYGLPLLNSYGNSAIYNSVSNLGAMNPAAMVDYRNISLGLSYQFESKIENSWTANIGSKRKSDFLPQSFGFIYPINKLKLGLSFHQKYNRALAFDPISKTTVENPDGTGETYTPVMETNIYNYSFSASYSIDKSIPNSELSFGVRFGLNTLHEFQQIDMAYMDETVNDFDYSFGFIYKYKFSHNYNLKFGVAYNSELNFNKYFSFVNNGFIVSPQQNSVDRGDEDYIFQPVQFDLTAKTPAQLRFDADFSLSTKIKLLGSVNKIYWDKLNFNKKNQNEYYASFLYNWNGFITPSIGIYYTDYLRDVDTYFFTEMDNMKAIYLTLGFTVEFNNFKVDLSIADSHKFSEALRKHTIIKTAISYTF